MHFNAIEIESNLALFEIKTSMSQEDTLKFELQSPILNDFNFTIFIRDALSCQSNPEQLSLKSSFVGSQFLYLISDCIKLDKQAKIMIEMRDLKQVLQKGLSQARRSFGEYSELSSLFLILK